VPLPRQYRVDRNAAKIYQTSRSTALSLRIDAFEYPDQGDWRVIPMTTDPSAPCPQLEAKWEKCRLPSTTTTA
jgi:hypothetical protein